MKNICMDYPSYIKELSLDYSTPYLALGDAVCLNEYKSILLDYDEQTIINNALSNTYTIFSESVNFKKDPTSDERIYVSFYKTYKGVLFIRLLNMMLEFDCFSNKLLASLFGRFTFLKKLCKSLDSEKIEKYLLEFFENPDVITFKNTTMIYDDLNILECLKFYNSKEFNNLYNYIEPAVVNEKLGDMAFTKEEFLKFLNNPRYMTYFKLFLKSIQFVVEADIDRSAIGTVNSSFNFYAFDALGYGNIFSRELYSVTKAPMLYDGFIEYLNKPGVLNNYDLSIKQEFNSLLIEYMSSNGYGTNYSTIEYLSSYIYHRLFDGVISNKDVSYLDVIRRKL